MKVVLITLTATFAIQLGYFLWKIAADSLPRIGEAGIGKIIRGFLFSWQWMLGLVATIVGWLFFIKATDLGDVSLVQPLMSIGDLFLVLLVVVFLHERLTKVEWIGLALTVVGAMCIASEAELIKPVSIDWFRLALFLVIITVCLFGLLLRTKHARRPEILLAISVGIGFGAGAVLTKLMTAYIALNGQELESMALLFNPILPFMVAANVAGLALLQVAFQRGRAAVIIPVQLSVVNALAVVAGALVFLETISALRLSGIGFIVVGTVFLHRTGEANPVHKKSLS